MSRSLTPAALLVLAACRGPAPSARPAETPRAQAVTSPQEVPDTNPPADLSHGEAPIGGPEAEPAPRLARLDPAEPTRVHHIRLEMKHATVPIAPGVTYAAWTFGGTVPGPALHVRALIVDPSTPRPKAAEYVFVQSEFYLTPKPAADGSLSLDWQKLLGQAPDHIVFNGMASQYATHPIEVHPNELLRLYLVNAGPNRISSFHVVGGIFERVFQDGSQASPLVGVQTVNVPVGGGSIFEVRLREPGDYPFVTHAFADATKGAVGVLRAVGPGGTPEAGAATH
jgi:FtsP/CotA-like multicopper oxidase with cupredoxin domain